MHLINEGQTDVVHGQVRHLQQLIQRTIVLAISPELVEIKLSSCVTNQRDIRTDDINTGKLQLLLGSVALRIDGDPDFPDSKTALLTRRVGNFNILQLQDRVQTTKGRFQPTNTDILFQRLTGGSLDFQTILTE